MTYKTTIFITLLLTAALAACGQQLQDDDPATVSKDNVFSDQVESLDKAKAVEADMQKAFDTQQQRINEER